MTDKTAIITGGSCAIGHNTAINLSQRAADVISLIARIGEKLSLSWAK